MQLETCASSVNFLWLKSVAHISEPMGGRKLDPTERTCRAKAAMTTKRSLPHCSKHAFTEFVKLAQDQGVEELPRNRMHLDMMRDDTLSDTPYGPLIVGVSLFAKPPLAPKTVVAINPLAYIYTAFRNGGGFFHFLRSKLMAVPSSPASPWRLCLYSDEVVPGNQLAVFHSRKVWCVYFSFLEFHPHLSN